jgi:carnitine O-acetyltransferase
VVSHNAVAALARDGKGVDRHLYALFNLAKMRKNESIPAIFTDAAYARLAENKISTSTISAPFALMGGFGAVNADGYGIGAVFRSRVVCFPFWFCNLS